MEEVRNYLEQVTGEAELNVNKVAMSDYTRALLLCRAKLSDVFNSVVNLHDSRYSDEPKEFVDEMTKADEALCKLIGDAVAVSLVESNYLEF